MSASALDSSRFQWGDSKIGVVDDSTTTCDNQATVRYGWGMSKLRPVYDSTATCSVAGGTPNSGPAILYIKDSDVRFKNSDLRVKR